MSLKKRRIRSLSEDWERECEELSEALKCADNEHDIQSKTIDELKGKIQMLEFDSMNKDIEITKSNALCFSRACKLSQLTKIISNIIEVVKQEN